MDAEADSKGRPLDVYDRTISTWYESFSVLDAFGTTVCDRLGSIDFRNLGAAVGLICVAKGVVIETAFMAIAAIDRCF